MRAAWVSWLIWDHLAAVSFRFLYNALLRTEIVTRKVPMDTPLVYLQPEVLSVYRSAQYYEISILLSLQG
jgi:hypothetical protein